MKAIFITGLCILAMICFSCGRNQEDTMKNEDAITTGVNTSVALQEVLTEEYDLHELEMFFKNRNINENIVLNNSQSALSYSEVNERYPIEVTRPEGYSIYKVRQGGYFYVFWSTPLDSDDSMCVYFSAYLPSAIEQEDFDILTPGESTAADVKRIDPNMELSFLLSSGTFSYSYLDDTTILRVEYTHEGEINDYDDLVVKNISAVPKSSTPSSYKSILLSDLP